MNVTEKVKEIASPVCEQCGVRLWDAEFKKEGSEYFLRLYIDKPNGSVAITDCENVSLKVNPLLDEADPIEQSYYLEVSSAGLMRELRQDWHLDEFENREIILNMYKSVDGLPKKLICTLVGYDKENITIMLDGLQKTISRKNISKITVDLF